MPLKLRRRIDALMFVLGFPLAIAVMHYATDFDATNREWWLYLGERIVLFHEAPMPYSLFLAAAPIAGLALALIGRVSWRYSTYGNARWANGRELKKFGLRDKRGIVLGESGGPLIVGAARHVMVSAGTRSGKTQGIVIPTLLEYPGAAVVIDAKGELWEETATARSKFSDVYRLEWTARETARYNPISLKVLPAHPEDIERRVYQVATILAPHKQGSGGSFFDDEAVRLLNTIMLCEVFDARHEKRDAEITNVAHWLSRFDDETRAQAQQLERSALTIKLLDAQERARRLGFPELVVNNLDQFADQSITSPRQVAGVVATLESEMQAFKSGAVKSALSGCDFSALSLVDGERPGTVYVVVASDDREFVSPMTTALITNIIYTLVSRPQAEARNHHSMLLLLEEFTSLKKTAAIPEAYDRGAGMGVHVMTVIQAFSQIQEKYGREALDTFLQNTDYIAAFAQGDEKSREMLANMVGKETRMRYSRSDGGRGDSFSENLEGVPLIMPQDWGAIPMGQHRILVKRHHNRPVKANTAFAYKNPRYQSRLGRTPLPPPRPAGRA